MEENTDNADNTDNKELLQVTVNGNSSLFIKDTFENYLGHIEDALNSTKGLSIYSLNGFSDSHTTKKAVIFFKSSDCIKISQFN